MRIERFAHNPIIKPALDNRLGNNINGPSLIQIPSWLPNALGKYYLYFAHHRGDHIRLAYADALEGPWRVYTPGTLHLDATPCLDHIASPDVHVDDGNRRIIMYYHGPVSEDVATPAKDGYVTPGVATAGKPGRQQRSFVAISPDGIHFTSQHEVLGPSYFRVFRFDGWVYALAMPGLFLRSRDGFTNFMPGPTLFTPDMRHAAVTLNDHLLTVYYTNVGDVPEQILRAHIDLRPDWMRWRETAPEPVLRPEMDYECGNLPAEPSRRGPIDEPARQLRDPAIYEENGQTYLLYSVAGEQGIALASFTDWLDPTD